MSIIQGNAHTSAGGYQIERSLRFNSADSAYLNRTPASASNRKTWTWSAWVKRSAITANSPLFAVSQDSNNFTIVRFGPGTTDKLEIYTIRSSTDYSEETNALFRDVSAWYHIVFSVDTTQATAANRIRIYVNGVQQTTTQFYGQIPQNEDTFVNTTNAHNIGRNTDSTTQHFNGYLTEVNFIDGQALTPSSFGETDSATGVWKPKAYTGTYGTNGFFLKFADNSGTTSTTLGKDSSGNGNNWTPNNFSVTAGTGNDSLVDSPTAYGTDTGVGGSVRGNYATLNALQIGSSTTLNNGNLDSAATASSFNTTIGTVFASTGKWYAEVTILDVSADYSTKRVGVGIIKDTGTEQGNYLGSSSAGYAYYANATKYNNASSASYGATYVTNDVIGIALDLDAGTLVFYKNNTSQGTAYSSLSGLFTFAVSHYGSGAKVAINFGQRAFAYTAPSGFKALCTQNLPTPTIGATSTTQANDYFNAVLYSGNGTSQTIDTGLQPDFIWIKRRNGAAAHTLTDSVRGTSKQLFTNLTDAEQTDADSGVTAIGSSSMTLGDNNLAVGSVNGSGSTYVAWNWKANGVGSSNTAGSITSTVSANTTSGFSIVTYTGTGANATVGHGLGVAPSIVIVKKRSASENWVVYHTSVGATKYLVLNLTDAETTSATRWNNTAPTSTVFSIGTSGNVNDNTGTYVAYCFAPVAGYSAFGSYTGNGSTDGPFVYTGFRPKYVLIKDSTNSATEWGIEDTVRDTDNPINLILQAESSAAEATATNRLDILSNGFKIRNTGFMNTNNAKIIYAAFAESPFKYSLAR